MNKLYFVEQPAFTGKYHIFEDRIGRSLCGKQMLLTDAKDDAVEVKGTENLGRDDCKACFNKSKKLFEELNKPQTSEAGTK